MEGAPIDCYMPPSPELEEKLIRTKQRILAGESLPLLPTEDVLDLHTFVMITSRPSTRDNMHYVEDIARAAILGTKRALVLLVDFSDKAATQTQAHYNDMLFSSGTYATGSMADFYREASYGKVTLTGLVSGRGGPTVGWYRAPHAKSYYTNNNFGFGTYPQNAQKLVEDVVDMAAPFVNFADYDNNGDGVVDTLVVVAAGSGAEVTGSKSDIWSHKWEINPKTYNGVQIRGYNMQPEDGRVGVFAHEMGHLLCGWPDLYDTDYSSAGTGRWDLMAAGSWNGGGNTPAHPTCWCKMKAGWTNPVAIFNQTQSITLQPYRGSDVTYKLPIATSTSKEYFLLSNRQQVGFDAALPGTGLLIEHCDDNKTANTDETHYLVDIVQADGRQDLNKNANSGDSTDPYPISGNNRLTADSTPSSRAYGGADSNIAVTNVQRSGTNITADINVGGAAALAWYYNRKVTATFAHYATQYAYASIDGLGWRRIKDGAADGVTNMFDTLCQASANGRLVHVYADGNFIYTMYLI